MEKRYCGLERPYLPACLNTMALTHPAGTAPVLDQVLGQARCGRVLGLGCAHVLRVLAPVRQVLQLRPRARAGQAQHAEDPTGQYNISWPGGGTSMFCGHHQIFKPLRSCSNVSDPSQSS